MNTEEAIELIKIEIRFLEKEIEICNPNDDIDAQVIPANKKLIIKYNQIIALLQQGEKYEQAYGELECTLLNMVNFSDINQDEFMRIKRVMRNIKQKYFPKSIKREEVIK